MKTEIRYSEIYNKKFNPKFSKKDFFKLKKYCARFEVLYKKHINIIIKLIEKNNNKKWKYDFIPIYIIKRINSSFSDPLTLKYTKNEKEMLVVLIHELLHNNLNKKFKNSREIHEYMDPIFNKIVLDMPIDLKKELESFNKRIRKHYGYSLK